MPNNTVLTSISDPGQTITYNTTPIINSSKNTTFAYSVTDDTTVRFGAAFEATGSGSAFSLTTDSTSTIIYGYYNQSSGSQAFQGQIAGTQIGNTGVSSTVTTNGTLQFRGFTDAGQYTQLITNAGGTVDFSGTSGYSKNNIVYAESIAGAGTYELGSNALYVGSTGLTLSTEVSGRIEDGGSSGGVGASLHYEGLTGSNTLILSGDNTYSGGTSISDGILQLGDGGASGSIVGNVSLFNSYITFDRSDTYAFGGIISGLGGLQQIGSGTTILTAAETYSGGTTVNAGTLQLGNGGSLVAGGALTINGGEVDLAGHNQTLGDLSGTGGSLALGGAMLTVGTGDSTIFSGAITGPGLVVKTGTGTLTLTGANSYTGGTVIGDGTLQLGDGGTSGSITGAVLDDGVLAIDRSDVVTIGNTIVSTGAVDVTGTGTVILTAVNAYSGGTTISGGTLELANASAAGSGAITFVNDPVLKIDGTTMPTNTIDGFAAGDTIDLTGIADLTGSHADMDYATHVLTVTEGSNSYTLQFDPTANFAGEYFHLAADGANGTQITESAIACYCTGTLILTRDGHKPVEQLEIGEEVLTLSGAPRPIKWIGKRSYGGRFILGRKDILPICFKAGSLGADLPKRDLWISPHHAMYFEGASGGVLIEARELVNGVSVVQAERVDEVAYFHIELESHDVILAEGAPSETFVDDHSRGMFRNASEYAELYPEDVRPDARYCAPRLDAGHEVEVIRRKLAQHAGLMTAGQDAGALRGHVDRVGPRSIDGWAQNVDHPEAPVCLDIYAGGRLIGQALANRYRKDLSAAGLGSGRHAFLFNLPEGAIFSTGDIEVRRSLDGVALAISATAKRDLVSHAA